MAYVIERAIVKGNIASVVETRNMFTAEIEIVAPDTYKDVWDDYLTGVYTPILTILSGFWGTVTYERQLWFGGHWEPQEEVAFALTGSGATDALANLVAMVFVGKGFGRRKVGRKFFSPLVEGAVNGNTLTAAALVSAASSLAAYLSQVTTPAGSNLVPGILDKNGAFQMFTTGFVSSLLGTIRRRKPGIGI